MLEHPMEIREQRTGDVNIERFKREFQVAAYERKCDKANAVEHYRGVIDLWKDADPEQVTVIAPTARVRRLSDPEGILR